MSDGEPNADSAGSHPGLNDGQHLAEAEHQANNAWAMGIHIYVVFHNRDNDHGAAGNRGKGNFVQVSDAKDLPAALGAITKKLPTMLLQ